MEFETEMENLINRPGDKVIEELIEQSFKILCLKLANGSLIANNEYAFQFELGVILKTLGQFYEFKLDDKFQLEFEATKVFPVKMIKSNSYKSRIDILIKYTLNGIITNAAIELKFLKKSSQKEPRNRYDAFKDISNLEIYKKNGIEICYFLMITDHEHYVTKQDYKSDTANFDFTHGKNYIAKTTLSYKKEKPYGPDIILDNDYEFRWKKFGFYYFLKLKV